MSNHSRGEAIRLTNKTARSLRAQAKQQRTVFYAVATVLSIVLSAASVLLGMQHLIAVPLLVLLMIALDALLIFVGNGRYLSLTAQAICTEAAARQLSGESAEQQRIFTAKRDLERIKADLGMAQADEDEDAEEEEDDEDMYSPVSIRKAPAQFAESAAAEPTQPVRIRPVESAPAQPTQSAVRRRRQARLQVLVSDEPDNQAN